MDKEPRRFEVKKWNAVAMWTWGDNMLVSVCAICRTNLSEPCLDCIANLGSKVVQECDISWGACNHAYHSHCISRWLKVRNVCPLDNLDWEYQKYEKKVH